MKTKTLLEELLEHPEISGELKDQLLQATIVKADNVAEYLYFNELYSYGELNPSDFPNLAPPFPSLFIEWQDPPEQTMKFKRKMEELLNRKFKFSDVQTKQGLLFRYEENKNSEIRWSVRVDSFHEKRFGNIPYFTFHVLEDGEIYLGEDKKNLLNSIELESGHPSGYELRYFSHEINVAFLTISLMHCKNVKIIPRGGDVGRKPGRRNRHASKYLYHVLDIEAMKQILRMEGDSESKGLKFAMHFCRAHFRHYGGENGLLFGKYEGTFFVPDHVRGDRKLGQVAKDYRISMDDGTPGGLTV